MQSRHFAGEELPHFLLHAGRLVEGAQGPAPSEGGLALQVPYWGKHMVFFYILEEQK
jgi:hypothetical protein